MISHLDHPVSLDLGGKSLDLLTTDTVGPSVALGPRGVLVLTARDLTRRRSNGPFDKKDLQNPHLERSRGPTAQPRARVIRVADGRPVPSGEDEAHRRGRDGRVQQPELAGFVVEPVGRETITVLAGHDNVPAVGRDDEIPGALPHVGRDPDLR